MASFTAVAATVDPPVRDQDQNQLRPKIQEHYRILGRLQNREMLQQLRDEQETPEMRQLIQRFTYEREKYLIEQKQLMKQLREATDQQRDRIRDQIRERLQEWREQQCELRDRIRERMQEMKNQLQEEMQRVVEQAREQEQNRRGK